MELFKPITDLFEKNVFGVCARLGELFNVKTAKVRLFFIYSSFLTFGSPLIIYLIIAFYLENKEYLQKPKRKKTIWDL
ncbi:MAG: PspC domain-containing protein [Luteibaculaceae bacterium]